MRGFRHIGPLTSVTREQYSEDDLLFFGVGADGPIRIGWYRGRQFPLGDMQAQISNGVPLATRFDHVFVATALGEDAFRSQAQCASGA